MGRFGALRIGAIALGVGGCMGSAQTRAVKLYDGPPDKDAVTLVGDVQAVDGREVPARSRTFQVLPGCHAISNITYWVGNDANAAMTVRLPEMTYWMEMRPGHSYELRIGTTGNTETARVVVKALERDKAGDVTRVFEPNQACDG